MHKGRKGKIKEARKSVGKILSDEQNLNSITKEGVFFIW